MQKTLLNTKWIGALIVVIVSFVLAYVSSIKIKNFSQIVVPIVMTESEDFLPISIRNGAITEPQNALISKNYGTPEHPFWVVLDTRADELTSSDIREQGIYLSRKYIYGVSPNKTEIRDLSAVSDVTINHQLMEKGVAWWTQNAGKYTFLVVLLSLIIYICGAISMYAIIIYLLLGIAMKINFDRIIRVTTLGYMFLFAVGLFIFSSSIITTFVLLLLANYLVAKYTSNTEGA